ncbi:MAG: DUF167 domain-containing protein [Candidatus Daviesbacteria bacterium]|nr:DUF167 domain-containing protein [Candidatus Daviesbacteria bacterium]
MKIFVKAKPKSKKNFIKKTDAASFTVAVTEAPEKGKANQAIIKALAKFLNIPASSVILISGQTSRQKVFEIPLTLNDLEKIPDSPGQIKLL